VLDVETFSTVDLKMVGLHYYAAHPTTGVSVACYAFGSTGAVRMWSPGEPVPEEVRAHIAAGGPLVAHNAAFESAIIAHVLGPRHGWPLPTPRQWNCTLARSVYHGLPPSLEAVSDVLPLTNKKDKEGRALMLRMARPRGFTEEGTPRWWHEEDETRLATLTDYCRQDVLAEQELHRQVPELPGREQRVWRMDAAINDCGIMIDVPGADALARVTAEEIAKLDGELCALTDGAVQATSNVGALKLWLEGRGCKFDSLDKEHLENALASMAVAFDPEARRALQLRQEGSLASTAKLRPMLGTLGSDNRARGLFQYYGAQRTGRWAGRRIQPQNLVRGFNDAAAVINAVTAGAAITALAEQYGCKPLELVAGCLRGLFMAPEGRRLVVADLAQIEARVLAWLAGQDDLLAVFVDGTQDVYRYTAAKLASDNRQLGKVATLGLGFQMGWARFINTAGGYGVILTEEEAQAHVQQWRQNNPRIVRLWYDFDDAVRAALQGPVGGEVEVGRCLINRRANAIRIRLPSGRDLIYHEMGLVPRTNGHDGSELAFVGVHPLRRTWEQQRTYGGRLVENITQATARDVLAEAMLTLHDRGHCIVASVHDEILLEASAEDADALLVETLAVMRTTPAFAPGLPVNAEGFISPRYRKA
jgi:DNA polymerase